MAAISPLLLVRHGRWHGDPGMTLWISVDGSARIPAAIYDQITRRTAAAAFGRGLNPYLFRRCAVTSLALVNSETVRAGGTVLGHADYRTIEKNDSLTRAADAAASCHAVLGGLGEERAR